ncbi:DUF418 domain-containing protein [Paracoccus sp. IB05]|uniref:DUF418 domain-containing protein n=1 Tax=Paracoccus sp. IB05 TaxID=2779367 RepID=UPI0018E7762A|nr:DUF418 domain-containing protein [Paracoccus sp. IB05]MBJ2153157.1 DUF418 domain-containing protein [Paracoccus sp. IB05]
MSERIDTIDAVRGFALAGILVVNSMVFASTWYGSGLPSPDASTLDKLIEGVISALFELKFYLLFSFLFGYSVTLQMQSAARAGAGFLPRMLRRQAGLFVIGALHAVVLFHGDILTTYAVLGLILLALRKRGDRLLIGLAVVLIAATALFWLGIAIWQAGLPSLDQTDIARDRILAAAVTWRGTTAEIVAAHIGALQDFLPLLLLLQAPTALAMFLLGYVAGRRELFAHLDSLRQNWKGTVMWAGLLLGLPGALAYAAGATLAPGSYFETAGLALSIVTAPFLSAAMVFGVVQILRHPAATGLHTLLAAAGRMALTNYLLQSLLLALVFHGYGLGLVNRLSLAQVLLVGAVIFGLQLVLSKLWLSRFRYGPLEWLLRALTRFSFSP